MNSSHKTDSNTAFKIIIQWQVIYQTQIFCYIAKWYISPTVMEGLLVEVYYNIQWIITCAAHHKRQQ